MYIFIDLENNLKLIHKIYASSGNMYKTTLHILFTDVTGAHRRVSISINGKPEILEGIMIGVDGSSIPGYSSIEKSDLYVKPASSKIIDLSRFNKGYWVPGKIVMHDGREHPWDPRLIADKLTDELHNEGYISRVGCELEFYVVENVEYRLGRENNTCWSEILAGTVSKSWGEAITPQMCL